MIEKSEENTNPNGIQAKNNDLKQSEEKKSDPLENEEKLSKNSSEIEKETEDLLSLES